MPKASFDLSDPQAWAQREFGQAPLQDRRLVRRLQDLAACFAQQPSASIPKACGPGARTKAAYRFFGHRGISSAALIQTHQEQTRQRCGQQERVLVVQDTTALNFGQRAGLGLIGSRADGAKGLWLHSSQAFDPAGQPLGLVAVECWQRPVSQRGRAAQRHQRPIAEKESQRWLNSLAACAQWAQSSPNTRYVNVADREADIYELFALARAHPEVEVLVRARHNRATEEGADLERVLATSPVAGIVEITVPRKPGSAARVARLEVRFAPVKVRAPQRLGGEALSLWLIEAREVGRVSGGIHWRLVSSAPVEHLAAALERIQWYRVRWQIEEYHRVLKSGCQAEGRQLEQAAALEKVLMVDLIVAWRVLALSRAARGPQAEGELSRCFSAEEMAVLQSYRARQARPTPGALTLREAVRMVAGLGGFLGRKSDGEPGAMTLWRGLEVLGGMVAGWRLAKTYG